MIFLIRKQKNQLMIMVESKGKLSTLLSQVKYFL